MIRIILALVTASVAAPALGAGTVLFSDDFSTDPNTSGKWTVTRMDGDPNIGVWNPSAGNFSLTTQAGGCTGLSMFANVPLTAKRWTASFRYFVSANGDSGADGLVFMFYKQTGYVPAWGGWLGFNAGVGAGDEVPGYGIELDNWPNPEPGFNDASANHVALIQNGVGNHLVSVDDARTEDGQWHDAVVRYDEGHVAFAIDGGTVIDHVLATPDTSHAGFGFGSGLCAGKNDHVVDDVVLTVRALEVAIDVKPGALPNTIRLSQTGQTTVAILSGAGFDATTVAPDTVLFAGAPVARRTNGTLMTVVQDVNGDALPDFVLQFDTAKLQLTPASTTATLTGSTVDGTTIEGTDSVRVLQ